jgi:hypothetical protein
VPADVSLLAKETAAAAGRATRAGIPEPLLRALEFRAGEGSKRALRETADAVYVPLQRLPDVPLVNLPITNPRVADAIRHTSARAAQGGDLSVREVQSVYAELLDDLKRAHRPADFEASEQAFQAFAKAAEENVPGLREANRAYAERVAQTERWQATWNAIQSAHPNLLQREYPSAGMGVRQLLTQIAVGGKQRNMEAAERVAEVLLLQGPKALQRIRELQPSLYRRAIEALARTGGPLGAAAGAAAGREAAVSLFGGVPLVRPDATAVAP